MWWWKMSEHMGVTGKVDYYHLPYQEDRGFAYCRHCKKFVDKMRVEFHEGFSSMWMKVICTKCDKAVWVANLRGRMKYPKDDKKCQICKKPTNHYDCFACGGSVLDKTNYWCSRKCYDKHNKEEKNFDSYWDELTLCLEEQGYDDGFENSKQLYAIWSEI